MKNPHFLPDQYTAWFQASTTRPQRPGWYECTGWRFQGLLHLLWTGRAWLYFGPLHIDPLFPSFGRHPADSWRGINVPDVRRTAKHKPQDLAGQRFGMLVGLQAEYVTRKGAFWMFQCDCGAKRVAQAKWVTSGNTASCGCSRGKKGLIPVSRPWVRTPLRRGITTQITQQ